MQGVLPRVLVFPILTKANQSSPVVVLSKTENGIKPIQGTISPVDPSCTYTATRLFLKAIYEQEFQDSNVTIKSSLNLWFDETFKHWLGRFVDADFYDNESDKTYVFILPIDDEIKEISSDKIVQASQEEFKASAPEEYSLYQQAKQFYDDAEKQGLIKLFGVLNCDISKNWNNHYEALYSGIFRQKGERWQKYSASKLIFPSDEELSKLKGLVLSGADHESYDESIPFHDQLFKFLQKINSNYPQIKVLGVCFGCQVLAHCLGGKASRMQDLDRPFIAGLEAIKAKPELKEKGYYQQTVRQLNLQSDEFVAVEAHGDHVEKLPEKAVILGSSNSTNVEMWGLEDRILSVQFHPEFNSAVMKYKVIEGNEVNDEAKKSLIKNFEDSEKVLTLDRTIPVTLCRNFLKYQV